MSLALFEEALSTSLQKPLGHLQFLPESTLSFVRTTPSSGETLRFGGRMDERQWCQISGTAGVHFPAIAQLLKPTSKAPGPLSPTIMVPLHFLHTERKYFEWTVKDVRDADAVAAAIMDEVTTYALPFFEKYGQIEEVKRTLESGRPVDWFVLTPEQRVMILAAIEHVSGSPKRARRLLDEVLAEMANDLPKKRYQLEKLRARLS